MRNGYSVRRDQFILLLLVILGTALRVDFMMHSSLDADEAIVGIMGKHILEGKTSPVFYYGQHYMGSLEAYLAASMFQIFGVSEIGLKLVPLFFSILLIPIVYVLGAVIAGRTGGRLSALFLAVAPASMLLWSSKARGGFAELIFIGALAVLFSIKWFASDRPRPWLTAIIWFTLGIGWWVNNQIIFFIVPLVILGGIHLLQLIKFREVSLISHLVAASWAFVLGGLPYWIYNIQYDFVSFEMFRSAAPSDLLTHVTGLFTKALPMIFGAIRFWSDDPIFPGATCIGYILYGIPLIWALGAFGRDRNPRHRERVWALRLISLLSFSILIIFTTSSFGYLVQAPRYLLPLYVPLMIITGAFVAWLFRNVPAVGFSWVVTLLSFNLASAYLEVRAVGGEPHVYAGERVSKDHTELLKWLTDNKINHVRTNYWIGYRLAFETKEAVTFSMYQEPHQVRIPEYETGPADSPLILVPAQSERVENALRVLGTHFEKIQLSGYVVLSNFKSDSTVGALIPSSSVQAVASSHPEAAPLAVDDNIDTRWGSAAPQRAGMSYKLIFSTPEKLAALKYSLGSWWHDYPRGLEGYVIDSSGQRRELFSRKDFDDIFYYLDHPREVVIQLPDISVKEVDLVLAGEDPVFDWSIAELSFYKRLPTGDTAAQD